jgi:hypothetical protein
VDFHGVNLGRYAHFRRNSRMFLDILELQIENKKNALGKTVLKMWSQICGKVPSFVHETTLKKKCAFEKWLYLSIKRLWKKIHFFFKVILWTNEAIFLLIWEQIFKTVFPKTFFLFYIWSSRMSWNMRIWRVKCA